MPKRTIKLEWDQADQRKVMRRLEWERKLAETRDGRKIRAATFADKRKKASREACRKNNKISWE